MTAASTNAHIVAMTEVARKKALRAYKACALYWDQPSVRTVADFLRVCNAAGNSAARRKAKKTVSLVARIGSW